MQVIFWRDLQIPREKKIERFELLAEKKANICKAVILELFLLNVFEKYHPMFFMKFYHTFEEFMALSRNAFLKSECKGHIFLAALVNKSFCYSLTYPVSINWVPKKHLPFHICLVCVIFLALYNMLWI